MKAIAKKKLQWCTGHLDWTLEQMAKVIWGNESLYTLFYNSQSHCWKKIGEGNKPQTWGAAIKLDKKINIWGCFNANKVGKPHQVSGIMDQHVYHNILVNQLRPSI